MEPNHQAIPTHSEDSKDEISLESRKYFHINDLPVELLREIFVTLKADWNRYYSSDGCTVAHVITMICRFWRFVALSEPRLWATFIIRSKGGSEEGRLKWFSECLKRSKDVHLELMVNFVGDKRYPSRQFRRRVKEIATPHLNRCTSLYIIDYDFRLPNDWIPLPNELKSLRDVAIVLDISPLRFPHPPHQTMDLGLPKRFRYLKLYTPSQCIPAFTSDSVMEHLSVSLGEDQINTVASLLRDVEPLKTLDFELATSPNLDISGIFPRSFPQLENLILRGGRVSSPIVAPRLKHLYCQTPKSLGLSPLDDTIKDILKGLISLEVRASNLPPDCLVHCHALECLGVYVTADESIRMLEPLLSTARPPGLDLLAYHCPNLQRIMFSIHLRPDPQAVECISNRILELLALRPRLSKVEIRIRIGTQDALDLSPLTRDLPEAFPARVVVWGPDSTFGRFDPPTFLNSSVLASSASFHEISALDLRKASFSDQTHL